MKYLMNKDLYHNIVFKKFRKHFPEIAAEDLETQVNEYFGINKLKQIFCEYCKKELKPNQPAPYYATPSIDHKLPKSRGGTNSFDNIAITCTFCNIVKGTMTTIEYLTMLKLLSVEPEWKEKVLNGMFRGRRANMLDRNNKEKKKERMLSEFI